MIQIIKMEHNVLIQKVEILKMASKMAAIIGWEITYGFCYD